MTVGQITLDGYDPVPGDDLVWQQMYSPQLPAWDSSITERIQRGQTYGHRRLMEVVEVFPYYCHGIPAGGRTTSRARPLTRWMLRPADPQQRGGDFPYSLVENDWCVLELVDPAEDGRLF